MSSQIRDILKRFSSVRYLSSLFLNWFIVCEDTTEKGRRFHIPTILFVKKGFAILVWNLFLINLKPLFLVSGLSSRINNEDLTLSNPFNILKTSISWPHNRRTSKEYNCSLFNRSLYGWFLKVGINLVALRWTLSNLSMSLRYDGLQNRTAYSRCGRTNDF